MQYSNLKNEDQEEEKPKVTKITLGRSTEDLLKKKESYWFVALVLTLIIIGSIIFYCAHTGGETPSEGAIEWKPLTKIHIRNDVIELHMTCDYCSDSAAAK